MNSNPGCTDVCLYDRITARLFFALPLLKPASGRKQRRQCQVKYVGCQQGADEQALGKFLLGFNRHGFVSLHSRNGWFAVVLFLMLGLLSLDYAGGYIKAHWSEKGVGIVLQCFWSQGLSGWQTFPEILFISPGAAVSCCLGVDRNISGKLLDDFQRRLRVGFKHFRGGTQNDAAVGLFPPRIFAELTPPCTGAGLSVKQP